MKYSKSAIGLLTSQYRSVLKKCWLINVGLFALGAVAATPANAADAGTWTKAIEDTDAFMDNLASTSGGAWDRANGNVTGWGVDQILGIMGDTATKTDAAVALVNDTTKGNEALYTSLDGKQAKLTSTSGNAGNGISITNAGVISAKAGNTTITVDGDGIKVGTIAQSQVDGLATALAGKINTSDIATTLSTTSTDSQVASAKVVYDGLAGKINTSDIATTLSVTSTDSQVASAKAVYDGLATKVNTANLADKSLNINAASLKVNDVDVVTTSGTQTLTNKTIDADSNTISNIETDNFKSGVIQTTVRATASASDTTLVTEKAISTALETKVNNAGNFTETTDSALIKNKTVVAAIRDTAAAVDANATKNTTQDNALTNLYSAVNGGTYNTTTGEVTGATALSSNFTATNLTAAANELLTDITVTDDGNYIKANKTAAQNLGLLDTQVKTNAQDIAATAALVGTTSAPKTGTGILAGKTITGTAGTNNLNMVDAIAYVADNAAGLNVSNVFKGETNKFGETSGAQVIIDNGGNLTANTSLKVGTDTANMLTVSSAGTKIGAANAIVGTTSSLDMGGNALTNVKGLTLTDGNTHTASLSANENGLNTSSNLTVGGYIKATGIDTSTANTVNLGGTGFTTAVTGDMTVSGDTTMTGKLTVNGDTTLAKTNVTGDLTVTGNTSLANTSVAGTLDVTGAATFGDKTAKFVDITDGAITVHDGTGSSNVMASIANNGDITTKGALDVAGLASLDGGINVNDKFAVDTNGKVTLSDGTNTATIEATQIKDSDGNTINNVMKVDGTGLYTGYVASESGFTVAQKDAVTGLYEETFTVNADGEITGVGLTTDKTNGVDLGVAGTTTDIIGSAINIGGAATTTANLLAGTNGVNVSATGTDITGNFSVATNKFTVDSTTGNTAVAGTMDIEGDTTIGDKFSVTATDGSMSAAGGKFSVNHNGAITAADGAFHVWRTGGISAANGNFTVDKDGNVTAQGNLGVQGTSWLKDTNVDGALSVTGESWLKNTHVDGALATTGDASVGGNFAVTGSSWLSNTHVNGDLEVSGTTKTGALTFNGSSYVAAMDQGDAAITSGTVDDQAKRTMATVATVAKTIGKLDDKNAHGVTDVSDVASAISSLSQNVETATGGTFAGAVWTGAVDADKDVDYTYSPAATATATAGYHDIMSAVSQVASNVGAATTVAFNNVTDDNTVNANIDALNRKVGNMNNIGYGYKNLSNGTTTQPDTVVEALRNIDASMGTIHGLADKLEKAGTYQGNLAEGTTVEQHLTALDSAIGNRANFNKMHYTQGSKTVVDAIGKLDTKLNSVDHDVRTLRHHFQSGMASAAALSALVPNARAHGNTQLSVGTGMYHGHGAMAVGGFHWFTDNILFNTGIAWDDNEATYRMGVTYSW